MLSEKQKRETQLSILEKLRKKMNGMFDLGVGEDGKIAYNEEENPDEVPIEDQGDEVPYAKRPQKAITPLPVGGSLLKPKKPSKRSLV
jgi:6-phosphogluconolactonase/glucosamine-6-phosphate isomerase/deaminase